MSCKSYTKIFVIRVLNIIHVCSGSRFKAIKGNLGWPSLGIFAPGKIGS